MTIKCPVMIGDWLPTGVLVGSATKPARDRALPALSQPDDRYPNKPPVVVNPHKEPYGPWTGRCGRCQSSDLWDDATAYGCNNCGAVFAQ